MTTDTETPIQRAILALAGIPKGPFVRLWRAMIDAALREDHD